MSKNEQRENGLEVKVGYYNNNTIPNKYYEIDGKKIPLEIDGKTIEDYFR